MAEYLRKLRPFTPMFTSCAKATTVRCGGVNRVDAYSATGSCERACCNSHRLKRVSNGLDFPAVQSERAAARSWDPAFGRHRCHSRARHSAHVTECRAQWSQMVRRSAGTFWPHVASIRKNFLADPLKVVNRSAARRKLRADVIGYVDTHRETTPARSR